MSFNKCNLFRTEHKYLCDIDNSVALSCRFTTSLYGQEHMSLLQQTAASLSHTVLSLDLTLVYDVAIDVSIYQAYFSQHI